MVEDQPPLDAVRSLALAQSADDRLERHLQAAEAFAVRRRGERDLDITNPLAGFVGAELARDAGEVLWPPQAFPHEHAVVSELAETQLEHVPASGPDVGQHHTVRGGDLGQCRPAHRAFEMHVQMRFRQLTQVTHQLRMLVHGGARLP